MRPLRSSCLKSVVVATVVARLLMVPASCVVHPGCRHGHADTSRVEAGLVHTHGPDGACRHGRTDERFGESRKTSDPAGPVHNRDECPICQALCAAACADTLTADVLFAERTEIAVLFSAGCVPREALSGVLVRGPPSVGIGC